MNRHPEPHLPPQHAPPDPEPVVVCYPPAPPAGSGLRADGPARLPYQPQGEDCPCTHGDPDRCPIHGTEEYRAARCRALAGSDYLIDLAKDVAQKRELLRTLRGRLDEEEAWLRDALAPLTQRVTTAQEDLELAEMALREQTLKRFTETGETRPGPGLAIQMLTQLDYSGDQARAWALEHRLCVSLDTRAFEKLVRAEPASFPFVRVSKVPRATIATDLTAALQKAGV